MKRLLRIFDLSKNEQRVVLIVIFVLIAIAFVRYAGRIQRSCLQPTSATEAKAASRPSSSAVYSTSLVVGLVP